MPKKRRTKKQKISAELRRIRKKFEEPILTTKVEEPKKLITELKDSSFEPNPVSYGYVFSDLRRFIWITFLVLLIQFLLLLTLRLEYAKVILRTLKLDF